MPKPKTPKIDESGSPAESDNTAVTPTQPSTDGDAMSLIVEQNKLLLEALTEMRGEMDALKATGPMVGASDREQTVAGIAAMLKSLEAQDRPVTGGKGAANNLVTVTFLQKWKRGRYQAGDSAGVPADVAGRLVNSGAAVLTKLADVGFNRDWRNFKAGQKARITQRLAKELAEDGTISYIDGPVKRAFGAVADAVRGVSE